MRKAFKIALIMVILLVLLVPLPRRFKNADSVSYTPLSGIYSVRVYRDAYEVDDDDNTWILNGTAIYFFEYKIFDNLEIVADK